MRGSSSSSSSSSSSKDRSATGHPKAKEDKDEDSSSSRSKLKKLPVPDGNDKDDTTRMMTELRYFPSSKALVKALKTKTAAGKTSSQLTLVTGSLYLAGNVLGAVGFQM